MVGTRRPHRVGGDYVLAVRGISKPREAAVERRRRGGGRRRSGGCRNGCPCERRLRRSRRSGSSLNSTQGDGPVLRCRSLPHRGERPDLVDRFPDERNAFRDLNSGRRRRPGSRGIPGTRDGEEDHGDGNDPPEERAHHAAFMEMSWWIHSVLSQLSFPARGILWEWIAVSPLAGSGFVLSRSRISEIVSSEWGTSFVTGTPARSIPAVVSAGPDISLVPHRRLQQPGATDRPSSRLPMEISRRKFRQAGINRRRPPNAFSFKTPFRCR